LVEIEEPPIRAWSFGLEAFGANPVGSIGLATAALATPPPPIDERWVQESYPAWLARVLRR
jgi:hypothetical protein